MHRFARTAFLFLVPVFASAGWAQQVPPTHSTISQIASGGGWKTALTLLNLSTAANSVTVTFQDDNGQPLVLPLAITVAGTSQSPDSLLKSRA